MAKIKSIIATVIIDKDNEVTCPISELAKYIDTVSVQKLSQPGNPMAQTPNLYGYRVEVTTTEKIEVF